MAELASPPLVETLRQAQRFGFFGSAPIEHGIAHAHGFLAAIGSVTPGSRVIDLGSGGGLPGLVIAEQLPETEIVLLDRRQKRTDFLRQAVARLGFDHVRVLASDADAHARGVEDHDVEAYDVVTARGFGPPATTLRLAARLLAPEGVIAISEPPSGDRWDQQLLHELGLGSEPVVGVRRFTRRT